MRALCESLVQLDTLFIVKRLIKLVTKMSQDEKLRPAMSVVGKLLTALIFLAHKKHIY